MKPIRPATQKNAANSKKGSSKMPARASQSGCKPVVVVRAVMTVFNSLRFRTGMAKPFVPYKRPIVALPRP